MPSGSHSIPWSWVLPSLDRNVNSLKFVMVYPLLSWYNSYHHTVYHKNPEMKRGFAMSQYILALDQGTTSSRAIAFDRSGNIAALSQQSLPQHYPQAGWVEHDPLEIWDTQRRAAAEVIARLPERPQADCDAYYRLWKRAVSRAADWIEH